MTHSTLSIGQAAQGAGGTGAAGVAGLRWRRGEEPGPSGESSASSARAAAKNPAPSRPRLAEEWGGPALFGDSEAASPATEEQLSALWSREFAQQTEGVHPPAEQRPAGLPRAEGAGASERSAGGLGGVGAGARHWAAPRALESPRAAVPSRRPIGTPTAAEKGKGETVVRARSGPAASGEPREPGTSPPALAAMNAAQTATPQSAPAQTVPMGGAQGASPSRKDEPAAAAAVPKGGADLHSRPDSRATVTQPRFQAEISPSFSLARTPAARQGPIAAGEGKSPETLQARAVETSFKFGSTPASGSASAEVARGDAIASPPPVPSGDRVVKERGSTQRGETQRGETKIDQSAALGRAPGLRASAPAGPWTGAGSRIQAAAADANGARLPAGGQGPNPISIQTPALSPESAGASLSRRAQSGIPVSTALSSFGTGTDAESTTQIGRALDQMALNRQAHSASSPSVPTAGLDGDQKAVLSRRTVAIPAAQGGPTRPAAAAQATAEAPVPVRSPVFSPVFAASPQAASEPAAVIVRSLERPSASGGGGASAPHRTLNLDEAPAASRPEQLAVPASLPRSGAPGTVSGAAPGAQAIGVAGRTPLPPGKAWMVSAGRSSPPEDALPGTGEALERDSRGPGVDTAPEARRDTWAVVTAKGDALPGRAISEDTQSARADLSVGQRSGFAARSGTRWNFPDEPDSKGVDLRPSLAGLPRPAGSESGRESSSAPGAAAAPSPSPSRAAAPVAFRRLPDGVARERLAAPEVSAAHPDDHDLPLDRFRESAPGTAQRSGGAEPGGLARASEGSPLDPGGDGLKRVENAGTIPGADAPPATSAPQSNRVSSIGRPPQEHRLAQAQSGEPSEAQAEAVPGRARLGAQASAFRLAMGPVSAEDASAPEGRGPALAAWGGLAAHEAGPARDGGRETAPRPDGEAERNPFQAIDRFPGAAAGHVAASSARGLAVGYRDSTLGYVELRTHLTPGGVHAALVAESATAEAALSGHLGSLATWLDKRHTPVETVTVTHGRLDRDGAAAGFGSSDGGRREGGTEEPLEGPRQTGGAVAEGRPMARAGDDPAGDDPAGGEPGQIETRPAHAEVEPGSGAAAGRRISVMA